MGNEVSSAAGCCSGPGRAGLARHEERYGRGSEPMQLASAEALRRDRISEWSEPGAAGSGPAGEPWWACGEDCKGRAQRADAAATFRPAGARTSAYLVADTPDGTMLMSTENGCGTGAMWLGDAAEEPASALRPVWDPSVRKEFLSAKAFGGARLRGSPQPGPERGLELEKPR
mmetsp:Transcript_104336/g.336426  ORF Transcript_104336/g.336426 Transcript_104336/m.336426 type:complete len:173 (-) Transcript_104336:37-555(-)